jgi:hypothetical protein
VYEGIFTVDLIIKIQGNGPNLVFNHLEVENMIDFLDTTRSSIVFDHVKFNLKTDTKLTTDSISEFN